MMNGHSVWMLLAVATACGRAPLDGLTPPPPIDTVEPVDPVDPIDPVDPVDTIKIRVETALVGTAWTNALEGSLGTYVTWYVFGADGELTVIRELRQYDDGPSEIQWRSTGPWSVDDAGVVHLRWQELNHDGEIWRQTSAEWSLDVVVGSMADRLYPPHYHGVRTFEAWSASAFTGDGTTFAGAWGAVSTHPERPDWNASGSRQVRITLNAPPREGEPCSMVVEIAIEVTDDGESAAADERFEWTCTVTPDPESSLLQIRASLDGEERDRWDDVLADRNLPRDVEREMARSFSPVLYVNPGDPSILAFPDGAPIMVRTAEPPPAD